MGALVEGERLSRKYKAIPEKWKGVQYRSRLEVKWKIVFDCLGLDTEYEQVGYNLNGLWYVPDWRINDWFCAAETKGGGFDDKPEEEYLKVVRLVRATETMCLLLTKNPDPNSQVYDALVYDRAADDVAIISYKLPVKESEYKRAALAALNTKFGRF